MRIKIEIKLGNDAMQTGADVAGALLQLVRAIRDVEAFSSEDGQIAIVRDVNGNRVGTATIDDNREE